jgi:hypothetical protein
MLGHSLNNAPVSFACKNEIVSRMLAMEIQNQLRRIAEGGVYAGEFVAKIICTNSSCVTLNKAVKYCPNQQFQHRDSFYPAVVIEVFWIRRESEKNLRQHAADFILGSNGKIKAFLSISINYGRKSSTISLWRLSYRKRNGDGDEVLSLKQDISNMVCASRYPSLGS